MTAALPATMATLQDRVLARIHALKDRHGYHQKGLATHLKVTQGSMSKILGGKQPLTLEYIETFCFVFQVTPEELVAEPGAQMIVLRPMEPDFIDRIRSMDEKDQKSLLDVLDWRLKHPERAVKPRQRMEHAGVLAREAKAEENAVRLAQRIQSASADARALIAETLTDDERGRIAGRATRTPSPDRQGTETRESSPKRRTR